MKTCFTNMSGTIFLFIMCRLISAVFGATTNSSGVLYEIEYLIRVYKNGTVERLSGTEIVPPWFDPTAGVQSKDVKIHPHLHISARLYRPKSATPVAKLPLFVYFHGGGFFIESPFSPTYHDYLNSVVAEANVVAVSINYSLAPEIPLPEAYRDSWLALKWVFSHRECGGGREEWLRRYADFDRVFFGGDSAGGNIAHNMAIRVGLEGLSVHGMFLNCPYFWGNKRIGNEGSDPERVAWAESIWIHAYPNSSGFDDPLSNPGMDPNLGRLGCKRVLVYVAELDVLRDRGYYYVQKLEESEWRGIAEVVEVKGEDHVFNLRLPNTSKAHKMLHHLGLFLNTGYNVDVL